jgi:glycosyltransferase involved in cell wall biosynthesis
VKEERPGENAARNRGALECSGDIITYLDDDAVADSNWLHAIVSTFRDPRVMIATGRVLPLSLNTDTQKVCANLGMMDYGTSRVIIDRETTAWFQRSNFGGVGVGTNMAFRRSVFEQWHGFDTRLGRGTLMYGGGEDRAFFDLIEKGYRAVYLPEAVVFHPFPECVEEFRSDQLMEIASQTGYFTLLLFEEPCYRREVLMYAIENLRGKSRSWRVQARAAEYRSAGKLPLWCAILAAARGPVHYFRTRLASSSPPKQPLIRAKTV